MSAREEGILLAGLDGANPLAFLAALGTLRTLSSALSERKTLMNWRIEGGAWRPVIAAQGDVDREGLVAALAKALLADRGQGRLELDIGKNLSVEPAVFAAATMTAKAKSLAGSRREADFVASFASEAIFREVQKVPRVSATEFHFIFGSGHQHFLETARRLLGTVQKSHLVEALFGPWEYRDERLSFRWDPNDNREYAYQATAPGDETTLTVWGANLLAFEALPLFPVMPAASGANTTAFPRTRSNAVFVWPIWQRPLPLDVIRSLLSLSLQDESIDRGHLRQRGIAEIYSSLKRKVGDGANFKWVFSPTRPA